MKPRISIKDLEPEAYKAMLGLESYLKNTTLTPLQKELIKIRVSQINGCAYCIQMHATDARKLGESELRIYALSAWRESPLFTDNERAMFSLAEEVTFIANEGVKEETYQQALKYFSEKTIAQIIMQVISINAWNRIAISTHMMHT